VSNNTLNRVLLAILALGVIAVLGWKVSDLSSQVNELEPQVNTLVIQNNELLDNQDLGRAQRQSFNADLMFRLCATTDLVVSTDKREAILKLCALYETQEQALETERNRG
jgi:hypothetical protein